MRLKDINKITTADYINTLNCKAIKGYIVVSNNKINVHNT